MADGARRCPPVGPVRVTPEDARYEDLIRGVNHRFAGSPQEIRVVGTAEQTVAAVQDAVDAGLRLAVRSGGHCLDDLVDGPDTAFLIDLSELNQVYYDPGMGAFAVEPGARLGDVYRTLYKGWG